MIPLHELVAAERWYCPDVAEEVSLRGTQATCAAAHRCIKQPVDCPLYLHFYLKTTAWYLELCD